VKNPRHLHSSLARVSRGCTPTPRNSRRVNELLALRMRCECGPGRGPPRTCTAQEHCPTHCPRRDRSPHNTQLGRCYLKFCLTGISHHSRIEQDPTRLLKGSPQATLGYLVRVSANPRLLRRETCPFGFTQRTLVVSASGLVALIYRLEEAGSLICGTDSRFSSSHQETAKPGFRMNSLQPRWDRALRYP
jgi:hypothetical protein